MTAYYWQNQGNARNTEPVIQGLLCKIKQADLISFETIGRLSFSLYSSLNSFQSDFDKSIDRGPAYIYGPALPRTLYVGFKIGSF